MKLADNIRQNSNTAVTDSSTVNNAGTAMKAGSSSLLDNLDPAYGDYVGGSVVVNTNNDNTAEAVSGGTFAYNNQNPVAKRLTTTLGGSSVNSNLLSGAAIVDQSLQDDIHYNESFKVRQVATAIRAGNFNIYGIAGQRSNFSVAPTVATDGFGNDNAGRVSRANPGNLTFKLGGPSSNTNPVVDSYYSPDDEKTGWYFLITI